MGRAGRKRKQGPRTKTGRLARSTAPDRGCDGVIRRRAMYASYDTAEDGRSVMVDSGHTCDALGRAWSAGLISTRQRDSGRAIAAQYWRVYGFDTPDSLARFQPGQPIGIADPTKDLIREQALNDMRDLIRREGRDIARAFDQLVIDINPDAGPSWLDLCIAAKRQGRAFPEPAGAMLMLAIRGLRILG
jgi:hypothetical protein